MWTCGLRPMFLGGLFFPLIASAAGLFGPEWTVTRPEIFEAGRTVSVSRDEADRVRYEKKQLESIERWRDAIRQRCPICDFKPSGKIYLPSGAWIHIGKDAWVLEVTGKPMLLAELEQDRELLQSLVWDAAREAGLAPHWRVGGGHIHLDIASHFGDNALLFRNFVVDLVNHPELFLGGLGLDLLNGPPLAVLPRETQFVFRDVVARFDRGELTLAGFKRQIQDLVYRVTFDKTQRHLQVVPEKYQNVNFQHEATVEIRGIRPQMSLEEYLKQVRLLEARIAWLRQKTGPIPYVRKDYSQAVRATSVRAMEIYQVDLEPERIRDAFKGFVEETGLPWKDYEPLMSEELKKRLRLPLTPGFCEAGFREL